MKPVNNKFQTKLDLSQILRALKYRNYKLYFAGQGLSLIGTWIQQVAMSWMVYRMTNSAFLLGFVGFASQLPSILLTPIAGVIADRYDRRKILIFTQSLSLIQALILGILSIIGMISVWQIIVLGVFIGCVNSFDIPTRQSFVMDIIERKEDIGNAIALNSSMFNGARLIGPSIAGILIGLVGEGMCFLLNAFSYIAVVIALFLIKVNVSGSNSNNSKILEGLKEGYKYVVGFKPILYILLLLSLISLVGMPYTILMPIFARDVFHGGPHTLGLLMTGTGIGALLGALYMASRKNVLGLGKLIVRGAIVFGLGLIVAALSKNFMITFFLMFIIGFGMIVNMSSCNTMIQTITDDDKRGRVMSFYAMSFMSTAPFGSIIAGSLAGSFGAPNTVLSGGIFCIIAAFIFAKKLPAMRNLIRPIYQKMGIIPEVATGIQSATELSMQPND